MKIGKSELVSLAQEAFVGKDFNGSLTRAKKSFRKMLEAALWEHLKEKFPERDFSCGNEAKTRGNIVVNLEAVLKCKCV